MRKTGKQDSAVVHGWKTAGTAQPGKAGPRGTVRDRPARRHEDRLVPKLERKLRERGGRARGARAQARAEPAAEAAATEGRRRGDGDGTATEAATAGAATAATAGAATAATAATEKEAEIRARSAKRSWRRSRCTPSIARESTRSTEVHLQVGRHLPRTAALPVLLDAVQRDWLEDGAPRDRFRSDGRRSPGRHPPVPRGPAGRAQRRGHVQQPADRARRVVAVLKHLGRRRRRLPSRRREGEAGQGQGAHVSARKEGSAAAARQRPNTNRGDGKGRLGCDRDRTGGWGTGSRTELNSHVKPLCRRPNK